MKNPLRLWLTLLLILLISACASRQNLEQTTPGYSPVQNGHLEYYRFGKGSPIVLITGYMTDISGWNKQFLATLATQHQVIVFDNRDVGGSLVHSTSQYDTHDLARDTHELVKNLHLKKPAILGISMGGMIAQQYAVTYPQDISTLILINTAIAGKQSVAPDAATKNLMLHMPKNKLAQYNAAIKLFFPPSQRTEMALTLALNRFKPYNFTKINPNAVIKQQGYVIMQWTKDEETAKKIHQLNLPVLILSGSADVVIPPINSVILAKTIPNTKLIHWYNGGHGMIYQYPIGLASSINDFLSENQNKK